MCNFSEKPIYFNLLAGREEEQQQHSGGVDIRASDRFFKQSRALGASGAKEQGDSVFPFNPLDIEKFSNIISCFWNYHIHTSEFIPLSFI